MWSIGQWTLHTALKTKIGFQSKYACMEFTSCREKCIKYNTENSSSHKNCKSNNCKVNSKLKMSFNYVLIITHFQKSSKIIQCSSYANSISFVWYNFPALNQIYDVISRQGHHKCWPLYTQLRLVGRHNIIL